MAFDPQKQIDEYTKRLEDLDKKTKQAQKQPQKSVVKGDEQDEVLQSKGIGSKMADAVLEFIGGNKSNKTLQKLARWLGVDNDKFLQKLGKNKTPITEFKGGSVPKGTIVQDSNGNYFMSRVNKTEGKPKAWTIDANGVPMKNKWWASVNINQTVKEDGTLTPFVLEGNGIYREALPDEQNIVYLNVQNPIKNNQMSVEEMVARDIDARVIDGDDKLMRYQLLNEKEQAINPRRFDQLDERGFSNKQEFIDNC